MVIENEFGAVSIDTALVQENVREVCLWLGWFRLGCIMTDLIWRFGGGGKTSSTGGCVSVRVATDSPTRYGCRMCGGRTRPP